MKITNRANQKQVQDAVDAPAARSARDAGATTPTGTTKPAAAAAAAIVDVNSTASIGASAEVRAAVGDVDAFGVDHMLQYSKLPKPKSAREAFDNLLCSASGPAKVRRVTDNVMAWNMKMDLVDKAQKTFDFSYFSIERDAYGYAYLGALLAARMRGVEVQGITDWMASSRGHGFTGTFLGADHLQELAEYGCKIGIYNPPQKRAKSLLTDGITFKLMSSDHDKLAVADAGTPRAEGETGGRNVAGAYHQNPQDNPASWRDDSVQIKGAVTDGLVTGLRREIDGPAVKIVKPDIINIVPRAKELLVSYCLMEAWMRAPAFSEADKARLRQDPNAREGIAGQTLDAAMEMLKTLPGVPDKVLDATIDPAEFSTLYARAKELANDLELRGSRAVYEKLDDYIDSDVKIIDQTGAASAAPGQRFNEMGPDLIHLIQGAQQDLTIQNPYVVLTEPMLRTLEDAAKRGVKITIVTNSPESTDSAITQGYFLNDWPNILARCPGSQLFVATGERKFHAKCFEIDGIITGDMSYNADLLSARVNGEIGSIQKSEQNAKDLLSRIHDDLVDPANKFKEWTILRNDRGEAILDGAGKPAIVEGPDQDVSLKLRLMYGPIKLMCKVMTETDAGSSLHHPDPDEKDG